MSKLIYLSSKELSDYFAGHLFCNECMMFHQFPSELKRRGYLQKDHAWIIPPHLTAEQKKEAITFNVYEANGQIYFLNERAMVDWWNYNVGLKENPPRIFTKKSFLNEPEFRVPIMQPINISEESEITNE